MFLRRTCKVHVFWNHRLLYQAFAIAVRAVVVVVVVLRVIFCCWLGCGWVLGYCWDGEGRQSRSWWITSSSRHEFFNEYSSIPRASKTAVTYLQWHNLTTSRQERGRGERVGGPGATEKTDASVPAHEDERAARGRETFPYATFHEDIRKKRSNFALASSILRGSTAGSSNQVCFQLRCNPFHWCHVYFAGLPAEWNTNSVNCEYCIDSTKYFTRNTGGIFWKA